MWYITQATPTWPAVLGCVKPRFQPLYTETCCLPWINSCETKGSPMWPKHDVTGMCASEFKTHPLSSWHLFAIIITQPQLSSVTLDASGAASPWLRFLASLDWRIQLCFLWGCGGPGRAGLPEWVSWALAPCADAPGFLVSSLFGQFYSVAVRERNRLVLGHQSCPIQKYWNKTQSPTTDDNEIIHIYL